MDSDSSAFGRSSNPSLPQTLPLWCDTCRSDEHLILHSIDSVRASTNELLVHVIYACAACGSFHAHAAPFEQVAALLNKSDTVPGLVHFGGEYLHCGLPMTLIGVAHRVIQAPPSPDSASETDLPDVEFDTKIAQCECGFRLELPT
ncbi:hypothetical protein [Arthrobacter cupressi]|uniref:Uncharacterized protein n=1 Tax=Arthrobacter cupressi TaxID=1045773 RepID=A0A1G8PZ74_9MICC|nr:hypothetical protein [Arthrobacter cupressi]NYD77975.1 hypothetical protein [Arthrobacter cupressi]SDI97743.1 hypothetical protein SAMN05216555_10611 [Arthrobacter cupressi]